MIRRLNLTRLESRLAPANAIWDGGGADNLWSTAANWVGDVAPQAGDDLVFPSGAARLTNTNDFAAGTEFNSLSVTGGGYEIGGNAINVAAGVQVNLATNSDFGWLDLAIGGTGGLTKSGNGFLHLRAANSYTGVTTISAGNIRATTNTALGSAGIGNETITTGTGGLILSGTGLVIAESISWTDRLVIQDQSTVTLSGVLTLIGPATPNARLLVGIQCDVTITSGIGEAGGPRNLDIDIQGFTGSTVRFAVGSVNSLTGSLNVINGIGVNGGRVYFNGQSTSSPITVEDDAIIGGTGQIGPVTVLGGQLRGGILSAGEVGSIGTLTLGNLNVTTMGRVEPDLNAALADRLVVNGTVQLDGPLNVILAAGTMLNVGTRYRIIDNDGTDAIMGTFAGAREASVVFTTADRKVLLITYRGGDGNDVELIADHERMVFAAGADASGQAFVQVYGRNSDHLRTILAYDPLFTGGVRVATGDITGDGVEDLITAPGAGGGPHIKVFDGLTFEVVREFMAYNLAFIGGVFVAVGDVNGDGRNDIVTGAGAGGGPHVQAFSGIDNAVLASFMAYDLAFTGGVTVAAREEEIITGAGPGGGPHVKEFSGSGVLQNEFLAFHPSFIGGVFVSSASVFVLVSPGAGGGPHVRAIPTGFSPFGDAQFLAYDPSFTGGVRVAGADVDGDGFDEIITSPGPGGGPHVKVWKITLNGDIPSIALSNEFLAFASFPGGVFVG
jgi:autotransporter-associated beta strand protein